jgi:hypothetical protein
MSEAQVDSLPEAMQVPDKGGITVAGIPLRFNQDVLLRQDLATIFLIRDNIGKRPIFFSWSDGGYPDQTFSLSPYLVSHGFVRKLLPVEAAANDSTVLTPGLGYLNLPRTKKLLWNTYHWQSAARERPRGWVDQPSGSILQLYSVVYNGSARALAAAGDSALAAKADLVARDVSQELAKGGLLP